MEYYSKSTVLFVNLYHHIMEEKTTTEQKNILIRDLTDNDREMLEALKRITGEKTATKALLSGGFLLMKTVAEFNKMKNENTKLSGDLQTLIFKLNQMDAAKRDFESYLERLNESYPDLKRD